MIALIQRVSQAEVSVAGRAVGSIGRGLLVFVGVERGDGERDARRLAERVVGYRVFPDDEGRMNLSVAEAGGQLLVVPQFTLAADTGSGTRAGFSTAAAPEEGERLFDGFVAAVRDLAGAAATGRFGAHMQVALVNDGPVTFSLRVTPGSQGPS